MTNMKTSIGIITTSRADYGIYLPLLKTLKQHYDLKLFVGGMHTSHNFGLTWKSILKDGFEIAEKVDSLSDNDGSVDVSQGIGVTCAKFGKFWEKYKNELQLIFVLGDRFEMFGAASSILPFNIPIAHIHGGEVTLGAIDNKFRNAITAISDYHFTSCEQYKMNVSRIIGTNKNVYSVGSLGVESALNLPLYSKEEFEKMYGVNVDEGFVLTTYHPETVELNNKENVNQIIQALKMIPFKVLLTLPNADTEGLVVREAFLNFEKSHPKKIKCFESLGQKGYFSAMKFCKLLIGNTSSGIIEAASFNKRVINVGFRQQGRLVGENVHTVPNNADAILSEFKSINLNSNINFANPYEGKNTSVQIMNIISSILK